MARTFNGTTDEIVLSAGACAKINEAVTLIAVVKPSSEGRFNPAWESRLTPTATSGYVLLEDIVNLVTLANPSAYIQVDLATMVTEVWQLIAITKASGAVKPNGYRYNFSTKEWAVGEGTGALANPPANTAASIALGGEWNGALALLGAWKEVITQAQIESLVQNNITNLSAWKALGSPSGIWALNQNSTSESVVDQTSNGANQTSISGTTVSGGEPVNYSPSTTYTFSLPPSFRSPRRLLRPLPASPEAIKNAVAFSSTLSFKSEISALIKISQKISSTLLSKFETSGKLIVGYKLPKTVVESNLSIVSPLRIYTKLGSTVESKLNVSAPIRVQYKFPKATLESKFNIVAPLQVKAPVKLSAIIEDKLIVQASLKTSPKFSATLLPKFETSSKLTVGYKLSSSKIESKFLINAPIKTSQKISSTIESKISLSGPIKVYYKLPKTTVESKFTLFGTLKSYQNLQSDIETKLSVNAKIKTARKLSADVEPKFSIYADLSDKIKLKSDIESIFSLEGNLSVAHPQEIPFLPPRTFPEEPFIPVYYA